MGTSFIIYHLQLEKRSSFFEAERRNTREGSVETVWKPALAADIISSHKYLDFKPFRAACFSVLDTQIQNSK